MPTTARLDLLVGLFVLGTGAGCGSDVVDVPEGSVACKLDPPGEIFTFQIVNAGTRELGLDYRCGSYPPIELSTADGMRPLAAHALQGCDFSCDSAYANPDPGYCWDCGPGVGDPLGPGAALSIEWDRRLFVSYAAPAACTGREGVECDLGVAADPAEVTSGILTVCVSPAPPDNYGFCINQGGGTDLFPFDIDLTKSTLRIEVE